MASAWESCSRPAVVVDCGTGYTKMGFSGNQEVPDLRNYLKHMAMQQGIYA